MSSNDVRSQRVADFPDLSLSMYASILTKEHSDTILPHMKDIVALINVFHMKVVPTGESYMVWSELSVSLSELEESNSLYSLFTNA